MALTLNNLVFDRSSSDVSRVGEIAAKLNLGTATVSEVSEWVSGMKGSYRYTDLNRVGAAVGYLTSLIQSLGYDIITSPVTNWEESDIPTPAQMEQYLDNIKTLRNRLPYVSPDAPADMQGLTFQEANAIEEILHTLETVLEAMQAAFLTRQANTFFMTSGGVFNNA